MDSTDFQLLQALKKNDKEKYTMYFEESYHQITKYDRLMLWLNDLNPHYNYIEFVQVAWQLTNEQRRLFNKKVKEYAQNKRFQNFINQIPNAILIKEENNIKTYQCKWRNIYYKDGFIQVFLDKGNATEDFPWDKARKEWNSLTQEYFKNRRLENIIISVDNKNNIINTSGLDQLEIEIVTAEVRRNIQQGNKSPKTPIISSRQIIKLIHNVAARNECINFLSRQDSEHAALDVQELVSDRYGAVHRDISFLFPISDNQGHIYLVWESAEFEKSKATHIFKCKEDEATDLGYKIKDFIESNLYSRSRFNSAKLEDIETKNKLQYFGKINHDTTEYQVWEDRMKEALPFLK